jgi:hypothetical protein
VRAHRPSSTLNRHRGRPRSDSEDRPGPGLDAQLFGPSRHPAEVTAVAVRRRDRRARGHDPGQPVVAGLLRIASIDDVEVPVAQVADSGHPAGKVSAQRFSNDGVDRLVGVAGHPVQRHRPAVGDQVHVRVDQARQYSRVVVVVHPAIGGNVVPRGLDAEDGAVVDQHGGAARHEPLTVEAGTRPDRIHKRCLLRAPRPDKHQPATQARQAIAATCLSKANDHLPGVPASRWRLAGRSTIRAWLYRIATNACVDTLRTHPERVVPVGDAESPPPSEIPWLQPYPDLVTD